MHVRDLALPSSIGLHAAVPNVAEQHLRTGVGNQLISQNTAVDQIVAVEVHLPVVSERKFRV